jgi:septal ring factor EnvC (AmiA/AmiB activator)
MTCEMNEKIDEINEEIKQITHVLIRNTESLQEHMRRSDRLEILITKVDDRTFDLAKKQQYLLGIVAVCSVILPIILQFMVK